MTQTEFDSTMKRIADLKKTSATLEAQLKPITDELEILKLEAIGYMQQTNSKRTGAVNGYYLTRVAGRSKKYVTDEDAAMEWLGSIEDGDVTAYLKLDEPAVVARAEKYLKETGEIVEFIDIIQGPEYITIKKEEAK